VLPFQHFSTDEAHANVAAQITDSVTTELAGLGTIVVASRTSASHYTDGVRPLRDIAKALDGEFVMEASAVMQGPLQVRVVDGASDRTVWVGQYDSRPDELAGLTRRITSEASTAIQKISSRP
jgi:TolB-like protein